MARRSDAGAVLALALAAAGLSACGSSANDPARSRDATATAAGVKAADAADIKQSGYVSAFNALAQNDFLSRNATAYASYDVANATTASTLGMRFNTDYTAPIVADLKKARAGAGDAATAPLDAAADALIPPLEEIVRIEREVGPYYTSRAYRDDDLARGKASDAPLKAAYAGALAAYDRLGEALSVYQRARNARRITELQAAGHAAEASLVNALAAAETMIAAYTRGDEAAAARQSPAVGLALERMRADEGKLAKLGGNEHVYKSVLADLTEMQGLFSDYRNGDRSARDRVLTRYNAAIGVSNQFTFPG